MAQLLKAFGAVPRDTVCLLAPILVGCQQPLIPNLEDLIPFCVLRHYTHSQYTHKDTQAHTYK